MNRRHTAIARQFIFPMRFQVDESLAVLVGLENPKDRDPPLKPVVSIRQIVRLRLSLPKRLDAGTGLRINTLNHGRTDL